MFDSGRTGLEHLELAYLKMIGSRLYPGNTVQYVHSQLQM